MKTVFPFPRDTWALLGVFTALACVSSSLQAEISEPDNVLYGTVVIDAERITSTRTDVVVEARRTASGPAVASYRMGSNPTLGDFYALRIPVEAFAPLDDPDASLAGDSLVIVLLDSQGQQAQAGYTIPERGAALRVDFGMAVDDSDGNGLPDVWEIARMGGIGQNPNGDADGDGQSNEGEWIAGTDPLDGEDAFRLEGNHAAGMAEVTFLALRAEGPGYESKERRYAVESRSDVVGGPWVGVNGFSNVLGDNRTVTLPVAFTNAAEFFRGRVWLQDR